MTVRSKLAAVAVLALAFAACSEGDPLPMELTPDATEQGVVPSLAQLNNAFVVPAPFDDAPTPKVYRQVFGSDPNVFDDRGAFEGEGDILASEDFESFGAVAFVDLPQPWTSAGVTYNTGGNLIVGTLSFYPVTSNVFCYNYWSPVDASVATTPEPYDMLGFDVTILGRIDPIDIVVYTDAGSYSYSGATLPGGPGSQFFGFVAPGNEAITGFHLNSNGGGSAPCLDHVVLGVSGITATLVAPGAINPRSKGVIPISVLSDGSFDATTLDWASARFGAGAAEEAHGTGHVEDVDGDGDMDMVLHFATQGTGIQCGDTEATLTGVTMDGKDVEGVATFKTSGCKK